MRLMNRADLIETFEHPRNGAGHLFVGILLHPAQRSPDVEPRVSSIDPKLEPFRMRSVSIQNLHLLGKSKKITTSAVYTSQCGEALGLLVFADSKGPQLNILESAAQKASSCNRSSKIYSIAGLSIDRLSQFQLGRKTDELLNPVYQLRRIPVEILKATPAAEGSTFYQISYLRGCNQAPIGLIQAQKQDHLQVSMLVAHYEGTRCRSATATWALETAGR